MRDTDDAEWRARGLALARASGPDPRRAASLVVIALAPRALSSFWHFIEHIVGVVHIELEAKIWLNT